MSRRDIVSLFYRHLLQDNSGRYFIQIGKQRYPVEVEDTAYVVWAISWAEECVCLLLSDGSIEQLDPGTLRVGKDNVPYCKVKSNGFDARFSRSSYYRLAEHIRHDSLRNSFFILLNGERHYIAEIPRDA